MSLWRSEAVETPPLRVLLAFDSFKGSLTASEACDAVASALSQHWGSRVVVDSAPMADGGEGSLELLDGELDLAPVSVETVDAIGRAITAEYLMDRVDHTAYIETARAAGLPQVSDVPLRPLEASSYGVGLVIADALRRGARKLALFLGGSATSDGGAGLMQALGISLRDDTGEEIPLGGAALEKLHRISASEVFAGARTAQWTFITDVDATLSGPGGAARSYAPQKGASPRDVEQLDRALSRLAEVLHEQRGREVLSRPGLGAAGGMAVLPSAICDVEIVRGGDFFARQFRLAERLAAADLVITGEGRFDEQSLDGKVIGTLLQLAAETPSPPAVIVLAGDVSRAASLDPDGLNAVFSLADGPRELRDMQTAARDLIGERAVGIFATFLAGRASA